MGQELGEQCLPGTLKVFDGEDCLQWDYFLIKTQDYCLQLRYLLNSVACFDDGVLRQLVEFSFNKIARLQPIMGLKAPPHILFWKCSERKGCSKNSEFLKQALQKCSVFCNVRNIVLNLPLQKKKNLKEKYFL